MTDELPTDNRHHPALDDWRSTYGQLQMLAGKTANYLRGDIGTRAADLIDGLRSPHAAQLVLGMLQIIDETQTGDRDILIARLQDAAGEYAKRDCTGASNRIDGEPQVDHRVKK